MAEFSERSMSRLMTCDPRLQEVFEIVVKYFDCTILCGHRGEEEQGRVYREGKSRARWGQSRHNSLPSVAVDVVPYPIDWVDRERMTHFAGFVLGIAASRGISVRWGGDWDQDTEVEDNRFDDFPHFELV